MITLMMLLAGILSPDAGSQSLATAPVQSTPIVQTAHYASAPADSTQTAYMPSVAEDVYEDENASYTYTELNGVSLEDTKSEMLDKMGKPLAVEDTPGGYTEYRYDDVTVGMRGDLIYYISVPAAVGSIDLDGHSAKLDKQSIADMLGESQFTAEDGEVYYNDFYAFKLFTDPDTGKIVSADIFDRLSE